MNTIQSRRARSLLPLLFAVVSLAACENSETTEHVNTGQACINDDEAGGFLVNVDFGICLSSSCSTLEESSCNVTVDGDTITINSSATITEKTGPGVACTSDCGFTTADCEVPELTLDRYTVRYGDASQPLELGGDLSVCVGDD